MRPPRFHPEARRDFDDAFDFLAATLPCWPSHTTGDGRSTGGIGRNEEFGKVYVDLPFGDDLVAFHFNTRNTSDETDSWQHIMHVHQRCIAGMAQALEVAANMADGTN